MTVGYGDSGRSALDGVRSPAGAARGSDSVRTRTHAWRPVSGRSRGPRRRPARWCGCRHTAGAARHRRLICPDWGRRGPGACLASEHARAGRSGVRALGTPSATVSLSAASGRPCRQCVWPRRPRRRDGSYWCQAAVRSIRPHRRKRGTASAPSRRFCFVPRNARCRANASVSGLAARAVGGFNCRSVECPDQARRECPCRRKQSAQRVRRHLSEFCLEQQRRPWMQTKGAGVCTRR